MAKSELKAGVVLSYVNLLIGNLIPFIYTPLMLGILGQTEYGLYGIAHSVMGYIGLLSFGIGGTIVRYISMYRAQGDRAGEERVIGLFISTYSVIAILILAAGVTLSCNLEFYDRSLAPDQLKKLGILVRLMTINMAVFMPFSVFSSIIIAHERFIFNNLVHIGQTVLGPCINLLLLLSGFGSVGLVLASTIMSTLSYSVYAFYVFKKLKMHIRFRGKVPGLLREILNFSGFAFLGSLVDMLYWSTDKLIIGWAVGATAVAVYNVGASFNSYVTSLSTAISGVLIPRLSSIVTKENSHEELTAMFIKVGRLQFVVISFIVSAFVAFGRQFINLWVGPNYAEAYYVALLTMLPVSVPLIQNTGLNILYVLNKHKFRSIVYSCIALLNVALTFWLVEDHGILGAAFATCLAYVVGNILIINWYYHKKIGLNIPLFWKNILGMSPLMFGMGIIAWFGLDAFPVMNWYIFFIMAVAYTVVYFLLAYLFMMNNYEREVCMIPVKKLLRKLHIRKGNTT